MKLKEKIIKTIKTIGLALCLSYVSLEAPYVHQKYIRNIAENSAVQIFGVEGMGSGAHVQLSDGKNVILTNKHICKMTGPLMVKAESEPLPIARKIISISKEHDLCAIEAIPGHPGIKLGSNPTIGDELYTLGHPRGDALTVAKGEYIDDKEIQMAEQPDKDGNCSEGKIASEDTLFGKVSFCLLVKNTFQVSTPTYPGNSGSPVVNKYGRLVGVVFAGNREVENMGFLVPLIYVSEFLENL